MPTVSSAVHATRYATLSRSIGSIDSNLWLWRQLISIPDEISATLLRTQTFNGSSQQTHNSRYTVFRVALELLCLWRWRSMTLWLQHLNGTNEPKSTMTIGEHLLLLVPVDADTWCFVDPRERSVSPESLLDVTEVARWRNVASQDFELLTIDGVRSRCGQTLRRANDSIMREALSRRSNVALRELSLHPFARYTPTSNALLGLGHSRSITHMVNFTVDNDNDFTSLHGIFASLHDLAGQCHRLESEINEAQQERVRERVTAAQNIACCTNASVSDNGIACTNERGARCSRTASVDEVLQTAERCRSEFDAANTNRGTEMDSIVASETTHTDEHRRYIDIVAFERESVANECPARTTRLVLRAVFTSSILRATRTHERAIYSLLIRLEELCRVYDCEWTCDAPTRALLERCAMRQTMPPNAFYAPSSRRAFDIARNTMISLSRVD